MWRAAASACRQGNRASWQSPAQHALGRGGMCVKYCERHIARNEAVLARKQYALAKALGNRARRTGGDGGEWR